MVIDDNTVNLILYLNSITKGNTVLVKKCSNCRKLVLITDYYRYKGGTRINCKNCINSK